MNIGVRLVSQLGVFLLFFIVPILDLFRLDLMQLRFYIFTRSFPFSEGYIFLLSVLLLVFFFVGLSKWFGRQFCGWMCPHNTFLVNIAKLTGVKFLKDKIALRQSIDVLLSLVFAPIIAFSMLAYFINPKELISEIITMQWESWSCGVYFLLVVFFFIMINRLRSSFCRTACPYGMFQMILSDKNSKAGNINNMFRGTGLAILLILICLFSLLTYSIFTTKGFSVSIQKQLQGVKAGEQFLYSYALDIQNDSNKERFYHIHVEGVPTSWQAQYPTEIKIESQSTVTESVLFHIDRSSINKNHEIELIVENEQGNKIERKMNIFPTQK